MESIAVSVVQIEKEASSTPEPLAVVSASEVLSRKFNGTTLG